MTYISIHTLRYPLIHNAVDEETPSQGYKIIRGIEHNICEILIFEMMNRILNKREVSNPVEIPKALTEEMLNNKHYLNIKTEEERIAKIKSERLQQKCSRGMNSVKQEYFGGTCSQNEKALLARLAQADGGISEKELIFKALSFYEKHGIK